MTLRARARPLPLIVTSLLCPPVSLSSFFHSFFLSPSLILLSLTFIISSIPAFLFLFFNGNRAVGYSITKETTGVN